MGRFASLIVVLALSVVAANAQSQSPPDTATWVFGTDRECRWSIDGQSKGVLRTDQRARVTMELGDHLVEAVPTSGGPHWKQTIGVKESRNEAFIFPLMAAAKPAGGPQVEESQRGRAETEKLGYWVDPESQLMWSVRMSRALNWYDATKYCQKIKTGGFKDWRLPTIEELQHIREPGPPAAAKGGIVVNGLLWSSTKAESRQEALTFDFQSGEIEPQSLDYDGGLLSALSDGQTDPRKDNDPPSSTTEALCVRRP